jgi:tetratricopeptide (TPR) repeat protein
MIGEQDTRRRTAIIAFLKYVMVIGFWLGSMLIGLANGDDLSPPIFRGIVENPKGERLSRIAIRVTNVGQGTSSTNGEFAISIPFRLKRGDPVEISVGDGWVVTNPWGGRAFIPATAEEVVRVQVVRKGDPSLISDPDLVASMVAGLTSSMNSNSGNSTPDQLLSDKAQALGFSTEELRTGIDQWSRSARGPFHKGLAALYARHYEEANRYLEQSLGESTTRRIGIYIALFDAEYQLGWYAQAERTLVAARLIEPSNPQVLLFLGKALEQQGKYRDAEDAYSLALAIDERAFGQDYEQVASLLNNMGLVYKDQGKYAEAEPLYQRSLSLHEEYRPEQEGVAAALNNLAELYVDIGRYAEAEPLYKRAIVIGEKTLGPEDHNLATLLSNLALLYDHEARYQEAEPLYRRALEINEKKLGSQHPEVATTLNNLAQLYNAEKRFADAEPLERRALEIGEKTRGSHHPRTAIYINNLAGIYAAEAKYSDAEPLYKRALELAEEVNGPDHPDVASCLNNLGVLYDHERKYAQAEAMLKRALAINEKAFGSEHRSYALNLHNLAAVDVNEGRPSEAIPLYEQALAIDQRVLGEDHPDVAEDLSALAVALRHAGRSGEAETCEEQAKSILSKSVFERNRSTRF